MNNYGFSPLLIRTCNPDDNWPKVDITETENDYNFSFDIPGALRDDIKIWIENDLLIVSGEKKGDSNGNHERLISERAFGKFERSFKLLKPVDRNKVVAELVDGVLLIKLPKVIVAKEISIN